MTNSNCRFRRVTGSKLLFCIAAVELIGCSGQPVSNVCGSNSIGAASGADCDTGGQASFGGAGATGGSSTFAFGGSGALGSTAIATGGMSPSGGTPATGGTSVVTTATGGANTVSTGGQVTTGGVSSTGGSSAKPSGGAASTGGTTSVCGAPLPGVSGSDPLNAKYFWVDESCYPQPIATAGFVDLAPVTYTYMSPELVRTTGSSTASRVFYSFIPASTNAKDKPVFVIFNGGPAGSTTGLLFAFGTGPNTLHVDTLTEDSVPKPNPNSWASLGNLLYIDSRQAGFSYGVAADATSDSQRQAGYGKDNFNFFGDAADFVRVILRVLKAQPALRNNPVVIVGESYGGMRTSLLLNMVLDPVAVGDSAQTYFVDGALSQEIQDHFGAVFKNEGNVALSRARIARQFGWQVLIQPAFNFGDQFQIQRSTQCDPSYLSTQRLSALNLSCPLGYTEAEQAAAGIIPSSKIDRTSTAALLTPVSFATLLGNVDPTRIAGLSNSTRAGAYRLVTDDPDQYAYDLSSWTNTQGTLPDYDRYYIKQNYAAYSQYQITSSLTRLIGFEFLRNLVDVHTFITRAALDFTIVPEVIPKALMYLDSLTPVVSDISIVDSKPAGVSRPGEMVVTYRDVPAFGVTAGTQRTVRFPPYLQSGHPVTIYQPAELYADVSEFLNGVLPPMPANE